jgi:hypothetical protein
MTLLAELPENFGVRIRSLSLSISFPYVSPCSDISWGINNTPVGDHYSEK